MPISSQNFKKVICNYLAASGYSEAVQKMHLGGTGAVEELESKLKMHYGMEHALCVSNATIGLFAIALALGLSGQEFITTPYTYGATVSGWMLLRNRPVFADIDPLTLTLDCKSVQSTITKMTKALLVSDIYGMPHDSAALRKIADQNDLWYISDCAQSLGACRGGHPAGSFADALVVSFTVGKTIFAGEGAAILTNNTTLYEKLIWFTQHPMRQKRELGLDLANEFALNGRIHPLAALWANLSFEDSLKKLKQRQRRCFPYIEALNAIGLTEKMDFFAQGITPSFPRFTASWKGKKALKSALVRELQGYGFSFTVETPPVQLLYRQPSFLAQYPHIVVGPSQCPEAERQAIVRFCLQEANSSSVSSEQVA